MQEFQLEGILSASEDITKYSLVKKCVYKVIVTNMPTFEGMPITTEDKVVHLFLHENEAKRFLKPNTECIKYSMVLSEYMVFACKKDDDNSDYYLVGAPINNLSALNLRNQALRKLSKEEIKAIKEIGL